MVDQGSPDPAFDAMTSRLLRREALRRAAEELNTTSGPGLEGVLARISAEVTAKASARIADANAAAISGNSGVGEKPSRAGARTAWASAGRPVDW